ncbi:pimeloyl-ACP methyl ester carboxylesterase [Nocardioides ginsengisegetis]|uniref:Pimeloyl-ACP methyl ester carboxylesterase n=1 Tax=Nocardioides ginsengisegetis TaxID=661491 RepID=A0A7W3P882_9ACTN|nr:alpha/beta hydrolase [Nocardioides ginsengisegetis]MBA8802121.1 pimeloyl-ACP methyl ester carboxylesterase [Nocardioides ginsengisegetis]
MSVRRRILGVAAGAFGVAAAGTAVGVARQRRVIARRGAGETFEFGSLRSKPRTVVADDGVPLHVEVDEHDDSGTAPRRGEPAQAPLTVVFCHGYALNLDCWHFQRAAYRGLVRTVFYDQRSHGRSGRSTLGHATIDQLAHDLKRIIDEVVPEGPIVLVGHSMGGMTIIAFAEHYPELFGDRIVGAGLISTTAGGLDPHRILFPMIPVPLGGELTHRVVATLARGHRAVDGLRRIGKAVATVVTDGFAFGDDVPASYVDFVDGMLSATPFEVVAEFFPSFRSLDKFHAVDVLGEIPTTIICGTADRLTSVGHSRKLQSLIDGASLLECEGAGHMVILERHDQVNAALDQLIAAAAATVELP